MSDGTPASPPVLPPLPDEAIVVRGGRMAHGDLDLSARNHHAKYLDGKSTVPFAHSVFSHPSSGIAEICRAAWPYLQHATIRVSTVGVLRKAGYDVVPDNPKTGHALIPLGAGLFDWSRLTDNFLEWQPNPEVQRRKKEVTK